MGVLDEDGSNVLTTKDNDNHLIQMVDSCPRCLSSNTLNTTVQHMCREIAHSSGATTIIASGLFEREFDMESFHKRVVSCTDLTVPVGNDKYFFYSLTTKPQNMESVGGKSKNTLCTESLTARSNMLDDCKRKRDDFRPAQHTQTHKSIGKDGVVETLFPDPHYTAETHMPLSTNPRLDVYFTQSELATVSLLLAAWIEHTCRRQSEYCLLRFEHRPFTCPTTAEEQCFDEKDSPSKKKKTNKTNTAVQKQ